jgi:SAM-dependent methyltransferase
VLDVGCGPGRVALHLQKKGLEAVGIDISPLAVEVCKLRGLKHAHALPVTQVSRRLGTFDTIVMYGNNFGLMGDRRRARWLLRRFHGMTSPQARIIAESRDPYATLDPDHLAYHERNRRRGRMGGQLRIRVRYRGYRTPWFDYLLASPDEMRELLDGTGWSIEHIVEGAGGVYIAVIEKAGGGTGR